MVISPRFKKTFNGWYHLPITKQWTSFDASILRNVLVILLGIQLLSWTFLVIKQNPLIITIQQRNGLFLFRKINDLFRKNYLINILWSPFVTYYLFIYFAFFNLVQISKSWWLVNSSLRSFVCRSTSIIARLDALNRRTSMILFISKTLGCVKKY